MSKRWLAFLFVVTWLGGARAARAAATLTPDPFVIADVEVGQSNTATAQVGVDAGGSVTYTLSLATGGTCSAFTITSSTTVTVSPGNSKPVTVRFAPTSTGAKSCSLIVKDGASTEGTFTISSNGIAPQISLDKPSLPFGDVEVGATSAAQSLTATNTGTAPLVITSAALVTAGTYQTTGVSGVTLIPGASTTWTVSCAPTTRGPHNSTFRIVATSLPNTDVALTCNGTQGALATNPTPTLAFGTVVRGQTKSLTFTLRNPGNLPITGLTGVLGGAGTGFAFNATTVPATLAAGDEITLTATFAPTTATDGGTATLTFAGSWGAVPTAVSTVLSLTGTNVGLDVTPPMLDFSNFRFDTRPTRVYHIANSGAGPVIVMTAAFTPDTGTASGELGFVIRRGSNIVTLPQTLTAGQQLDVTVTAQPNNRTGLVAGHVDITSDVAGSGRVDLTGNATAAVVAPVTVDYGPVDLDGAGVAQTIMVTNTGDAAVDISNVTKSGAAAALFTVDALPPTVTVSPNTTLAIRVTYKPTTQHGPDTPDVAVLSATLQGVIGGGVPGQMLVTLKGRGIDRTLVVQASPSFPPTFRNPGSDAPIRTVTVRNNGEAVLKVSALMVAGEPVWHLLDPAPIDIAGGASHDFQIRFSPTAIGPAPAGKLTIVNNDNANPMAEIPLTGTGIGRGVAFGPATISLGYTGVGVPVTVPDILSVTNMDATTPFTIRAIELTDGARFHVDNAPADVMLPAATARTYSLTFTPTEAGHFETVATLLLDGDPEAQATVTITGDAVFVAAHGSGGCDARRGGGGLSGGALLVAIAALRVGRRRRRPISAAVGVAAVGVAATVGAPAAAADGVDATVFAPTPALTGHGFQLQSPEVGPSGSWVASAVASYAANPLVLDGYDQGTRVLHNALVERSSGLHLGLALGLLDRFELGANLPLYMQSGQDAGRNMDGSLTGLPIAPAKGTAIGNLVLHAKARLWRGDALALGASAMAIVPTATAGQFTGADRPAGRLLLLATVAPAALGGRLELSVNAGPVLRGESTYANIAQQSGVAWGAGAAVRLTDALWATGELFGEATPSGERQAATAAGMPAPSLLAPVEWLAGVSLRLDPRIQLGVAAGRGLTDAIGTPDLRGVFTLALVAGSAPTARPQPTEPVVADVDSDGDGVVDRLDKCPSEPEDKDLFEDDDGCPDADNDRDGLADAADKCPNEPETINGITDDDGCPDKGDSTIVLSPDRIETLDPIQFTGTKPTKGSQILLAQVAATLRAHPEIIRVRVTVHVQPTDDSDADQTRSDKRAQAVRDWLIQWGIAKSRLDPRGFGGDKPLVAPDKRGAARINDRIEFIILERK